MELAKHFIRTNIEPEWMVLCLLPVLPPELRPIVGVAKGSVGTPIIDGSRTTKPTLHVIVPRITTGKIYKDQ